MKAFYILIGLTCGFFFNRHLPAQQPTAPLATRIRFEHLTVADGLPENSVPCMIQDHLGFIWMGTYDGLVRYDGTQFVSFPPDAKNKYAFNGKQIRSIHEDHNGDIWIGSESLFRFERATGRFIEYPQKAPEGNRTRTFVAFIHEDQRGDIWTLTWSYLDEIVLLNRLNRTAGSPKTATWTYFRHSPTNPNSLVANSICLSSTNGIHKFAFLEDKSGTIWVITAGDEHILHRFDPKTNRFNRFTPKASPTVAADFKRISLMAEDGQGQLYVSSRDQGLFRVQPQPDGRPLAQVIQFKHDPKNPRSICSDSVTNVYPGRDGAVWVSTSQGLDRLDLNGGSRPRFTHFVSKPNDPDSPGPGLLTFLAETPNGDLWFATADGLNRYNRRRQAFERYEKRNEPDGLKAGNGIRSFLVDRNGVVWAGALDDGVYKQSRTVKFPFITNKSALTSRIMPGTVSSSYVIRMYEAPSEPGIIWLGTDVGLERLDRKTGHRTLYYPEEGNGQSIGKGEVFDMVEDKQGRFWVGTVGGGLHLLDRKRGTFTRLMHSPANANSLMDDNIRAILPASDGTLWIGTYQGLDHYDPVRQTFTHYYYKADSFKGHHTGLNSAFVFALAEDTQKRIWIGASQPGSVQVLDPRTGQFTTILPVTGGLASVQFLLADTQPDCYWVGDFTSGLWLVNDKGRVLKHFTRTNGLPINTVFTGHRDKQGILWVGTGNGMVRLDQRTNQIRHFTQRNGLQGLFTPTLCAGNGEVYAGSDRDVVALFPNQAQDDSIPPPVVLTDLAINGKTATPGKDGQLPEHVSVAKEITLPHNRNDLTFQFAALNYNRGSESRYAYRLVPADKNWVQSGTTRQARYSDLRPGTYTFQVKAANADGVWNETGTSIRLTILPPWWQTWWAYLLYGLFFLALLRAYIVYRSRALVRENRILEEKVARRTNEVQEQKEKILVQRDHLEQTLTELKATQAQLIQKEKLASLGELTAGIAHEIQNPLNFVNNFSELSVELAKELKEERLKLKEERDEELENELVDDLIQNQEKINLHGKRASSIVKGMLEHSRTGSGESQLTDINQLADEYLRLSYHGMRAKDNSFQADYELISDTTLPLVNVVPQEIGRVLSNLLNNAFYAVKDVASPKVIISTSHINKQVTIKVKDNGTGIPDAIKAKIFQPFFTTKPTGEGTGLGLSLAYDIVTKGHGGTIEAESVAGEGTTFVIRLPYL